MPFTMTPSKPHTGKYFPVSVMLFHLPFPAIGSVNSGTLAREQSQETSWGFLWGWGATSKPPTFASEVCPCDEAPPCLQPQFPSSE